MNYAELTQEELIEKLTERDLLIATRESELKEIEKAKTDLETERDSFDKELRALKEKYAETVDELKQTKELNFTLGRQVHGDHKQIDTDNLLHEMFNPKRREN